MLCLPELRLRPPVEASACMHLLRELQQRILLYIFPFWCASLSLHFSAHFFCRSITRVGRVTQEGAGGGGDPGALFSMIFSMIDVLHADAETRLFVNAPHAT